MPLYSPEDMAAWCAGTWTHVPSCQVSGVIHDSRTVTNGQLFVAIRGERHDGHRFIGDARARGAAAAMVDRAFVPDNTFEFPLLRVDDTRKALVNLARGYRRSLSASIVGITGSVGKTTVKEMVAWILETVGPVAKTQGNWNNDVGLPLSLLNMSSDVSLGVFELGMNHPGEIAGLTDVLAPQSAIVTNVGPVHLEHFESLDAIAREKGALLAGLPPDGTALIAADGGHASILNNCSTPTPITIAQHESATTSHYRWSHTPPATLDVWSADGGSRMQCMLPVPGRHQAENAALSSALAIHEFNVSPSVVAQRLSDFRPVAMRWQRHDIGGIIVINDAYNANPMSMAAAVELFRDMPSSGQKWMVLGDMLELGANAETYHDELGQPVASVRDGVLVAVGELAGNIANAAAEAGFPSDRIYQFSESAEAGALLVSRADVGDAVLLKGSRAMALETIVDMMIAAHGAKEH